MEKVVFFLSTDFFHHLDREQAGEGVGLLTAGATDPSSPKRGVSLEPVETPPLSPFFSVRWVLEAGVGLWNMHPQGDTARFKKG